MKNNELIIKEVTLAKCDGVSDQKVSYERSKCKTINVLSFTVIRTITCVFDSENNNVIDIETGEVWSLPLRDECGRITDLNEEQILQPLLISEKDWDKISYLYQLAIKSQAKRVYQRYLENVIKPKCKKIGSKNEEK